MAALPEIDEMRTADIRSELESYGIPTKSFLEKKDMVAALQQARKEGKTPKSSTSAKSTSSSAGDGSSSSSSNSREERIKEEINKANELKVGELKKKLQGMGISTKSFFEKYEFVKAYAEAVVDGVGTGASGAGKGSSTVNEELYDSSYRDVVMQKFDPRKLRESVIDIRLPGR
jgi:hypothetical protein